MRKYTSLLGFFCAATLVAQSTDPFFPKLSYFKNHFARPVTKVELKPPVRLADYVVDGKLELSMKSFLDLAMANNPDIFIQKLSVEVNRNAITRAFAPFDPMVTARYTTTRQKSIGSDALAGATTLNTLTQPLSLTYTQTLQSGMQYNVNFAGTKSSTNSSFSTYNPSLSTTLNFNITQPLLKGRGSFLARLPITIARSRLRAAEYTLEDSVIQLVVAAETAYWNVVEARENLRVQEESLKLNKTALERAEKELELGASSQLDIYQPQASYATAEISVTQARYRLQQSEDALRRQIGADLDAQYQNMPIVLTESVSPPSDTEKLDKQKLVELAFERRPDIKAQRQSLDVDDLNIRGANDALRPDLSFTAQYGGFGRGGPYYSKQNIFAGDGTSSQVITVIPGGLSDALGQLFGFGLPTYGFGLTLRLPIRDRNASANLADALVSKKLDAYRVRAAEENARLQVLTAISNVENSRASVELAKVARDLAQKRVEAEQKKYELGTSVIFFVLAAQGDLTTAESALVRESIDYRRNRLTLLQRTGQLLEERGIVVQ